MSGLYIHIPFCARRCPYCDFAVHIGADDAFRRGYVASLKSELQSTLSAHAEQDGTAISTIFFGGGTPTAIGAQALNDLLLFIRDHVQVARDAEISLEGNPEDGSCEEYELLLSGGWNRLSLGVQSFDDAVLKTLGRCHSSAQVQGVISAARSAGWHNISFDLIYAVPGQKLASWHQSLDRALALEAQHLSCYSLTIEEGTAFAHRVERGRMETVETDVQAEFMEMAQTTLAIAGFERYEISNWARPGFECRHNCNYWRGGDYLACGCGAHGHRAGHRWWNERAAPRYIQLMQTAGSARIGEESLSAIERLEEHVMLGLRWREGFDLKALSQTLHIDARGALNGRLDDLLKRGVLEMCDVQNERIHLRKEQWAVADAVARQLLV